MTNVLQSQYNCRLNNIDIMIKQILGQKQYKISHLQSNRIRINFPNKNVSEYFDLTNINHIWLLMGPNVRLYLYEFELLKQTMKTLKELTENSIIKVNNILSETYIYKDPDNIIDKEILDKLIVCYEDLVKKNEECHILADEILRLVNLFKSIFNYANNINNLNNEYRKIVDNEWFHNLFYIYEKYEGTYPVSCDKFVEHFKNIYNSMIDMHKDELVSIINFYLGGHGAKSYLDISKNLDTWIRRNYDCVNSFISNKIILNLNSVQFL
jgi:uncharacterized phage-associated protein